MQIDYNLWSAKGISNIFKYDYSLACLIVQQIEMVLSTRGMTRGV